jgi:hypothetical protein
MTHMLALLILAHLLGDYALQGDFMAKAKNHKAPIPGIPWQTILVSHAAMHSLAVYLITGSIVCAMFEQFAHTLTDYYKSDGKISFNADQAIHILCKIGYVVFLSLCA